MIRRKTQTILLDAGHGGRDAGARVKGPNGYVVEKDFALNLVKQVGEKLSVLGHTVLYTRAGDEYPSISERVASAKNRKVEMLISIHGDMYYAGKPPKYTSVLFHVKRPTEKKLANCIAQDLEKTAKGKIRVAPDSERGSLMILRESTCPAVTIEIGDMIRASEPEKQEQIVDAIVQGVQKYLG
jgi:N-acetylmuramoyl-L-alanine amidase